MAAAVAVLVAAIAGFVALRGDNGGDGGATTTSATPATSATAPEKVSGEDVVQSWLASLDPSVRGTLSSVDLECVAGALDRNASPVELQTLVDGGIGGDASEAFFTALDLCVAAGPASGFYAAQFEAEYGLSQSDAACIGDSLSTRLGLGSFLRIVQGLSAPEETIAALDDAAAVCNLALPPALEAATGATTPSSSQVPPATAEPAGFSSPDAALAWFFADATPRHAALCDALAGREAELGGTVMCARLVEDRSDTRIYMEGVFATDDVRYWVLVGSGSAGWNIADWSEGEARPPW